MAITYEEVLAVADELVKEFGQDYVYPEDNCVYQIDGQPSCIVGHIVNRLDPEDFQKLVDFENRVDTRSFAIGETSVFRHANGSGVLEYIATPSVEIAAKFEEKAFKFLERVQSYQDEHTQWGKSAEFARVDAENDEDFGW